MVKTYRTCHTALTELTTVQFILPSGWTLFVMEWATVVCTNKKLILTHIEGYHR